MQKDLTIGILNATYGSLLTDRQREIITQYYDYDLSLMEISQNLGISRQAVLDAIKKGGDQLRDFELNLRMVEKKIQSAEILSKLMTSLQSGNTDEAIALTESLILKNQE